MGRVLKEPDGSQLERDWVVCVWGACMALPIFALLLVMVLSGCSVFRSSQPSPNQVRNREHRYPVTVTAIAANGEKRSVTIEVIEK